MKEIKFKAWHRIEKCWATHDELLSEVPVSATVKGNVLTVGGGEWELVLYTGLKDKMGREIHNGDILQDEKGVGRVTWVQEHCAFLIFVPEPAGYHYLESDGQLKNSEVIGNIYDNPDLIS